MKPRIALVTHAVANGGGTASVVRFLRHVLCTSGRYETEIISLATSSLDEASVRLCSPGTWWRGVQSQDGQWEGRPYRHVGAWLVEAEIQRYRPRPCLTEMLDRCDLVQVVGGTPSWTMAASETKRPLAMFTATTTVNDRAARRERATGVRSLYFDWMNEQNRRIERRALERADAVFAETEYTRAQLPKDVACRRLNVAPPGVNINVFYPARTDERTHILAVGRFSDPRKNVSLLVDAYAAALARNPFVPPLVIAGTPPDAAGLQRIAALGDRVSVRIEPDVEALADLYRRAQVFLLPSHEEGLGIVALEAMSSGTPVVSTRCGGPETIIDDGVSGYLVPQNDPDAMARTILNLIDSPSTRLAVGETARAMVEAKYSYEAAGRIYLETFDQMLEAERPCG